MVIDPILFEVALYLREYQRIVLFVVLSLHFDVSLLAPKSILDFVNYLSYLLLLCLGIR
jgi:hypothetical protein